ncbi:MAG: hypothetical protein ABIH79_02745 [archaeon]
MKNKRAQFFGLYLVFITLLLCGIVMGLYHIQQKNAFSSLVSPKEVLEVRDDLEIFEIREVSLIRGSLVEASKTEVFGTENFREEFRRIFIEGILVDEGMKEFIFSNLTLKGKSFEEDARLKSKDFFENGLYLESLTKFENGKLIFGRGIIGKDMYLKATDKDRISFPVDFSFEFSKAYLINFKNGEFEVKAE